MQMCCYQWFQNIYCGHELTRQELDDGREDKSLALLQAEELKDEDKETHTTQDSGQCHGGLDNLKIDW